MQSPARAEEARPGHTGTGGVTRLRVASLNMSGAQGAGVFERFVRRCAKWAPQDGIDMVLGQEHDLNPARLGELERYAELKGFGLVVAFAPRGVDGVHHGGVLMLVSLRTVDWPELKTIG